MNNRHRLLPFVALLLAVGGQAQVISHVASIAPLPALTAGGVHEFQLPGFDPSLGTLTGVRLTLDGFVEQRARGENLGGPASFSYNLTSSLTLARAGGPTLFSSGPVGLAGSGSLAGFDGGYDFAGASGFDSSLVTTPVDGIHDVAAEIFASFSELAALSFVAELAGSSFTSSSGNAIFQSTNLAGGTLEVTYTYAAIPEPPLFAAIAGLLALAAGVRRRRAAAAA